MCEMKKCSVCGIEKPVSEFSKSYPNRCKACVAEHTKEVRRAAKAEIRSQNSENIAKSGDMCSQIGENRSQWVKATVRNTGEVVMVRPSDKPVNVSMAFYEMENGRKFMPFHLQFEKEIDWEQRRYEIAKSIFSKLIFMPQEDHSLTAEADAQSAVEYADILIAELKKGGQE